jgi:tight adherence protein C
MTVGAVLVTLAVGLLVAGAFVLVANAAPNARRRRAAVDTVRRWAPAPGGPAGGSPRRSPLHFLRRLEPIGRKLSPKDGSNDLRQRIAAAGLAGRISADAFVGLRFALTVAAVVVCILVLSTGGGSAGSFLVALLIPLAAYVGPGLILGRLAASRSDRVSAALPDALDLLAVTVEAGLGLYGAIARLVESMTGPLADEFELVLTELRVGQSSERALRGMAERVDTPEVAALVRSLVQGERLGLSLATTLRNLAGDVRKTRRAVAEERAAKAPVKMLFPAAFFIFPALFIVILGPAVLVLRTFL